MADLLRRDGPPAPGQTWENLETFFAGLITATSSGAAQTLYTAPSDTGISGSKVQHAVLRSIRMMNNDSSSRTLALYIVPNGANIADDYLIVPSVAIAAKTLYHEVGVDELVGNGATIQAYASSASKIIVRLTGSVYR